MVPPLRPRTPIFLFVLISVHVLAVAGVLQARVTLDTGAEAVMLDGSRTLSQTGEHGTEAQGQVQLKL